MNQCPVNLRRDAGPGRIVFSAAILLKSEELLDRGFIINMGLANATGVQQETDALCHHPFKLVTYAHSEKVFQARLRDRGLPRRSGAEQSRASMGCLES